MKKQINQDFLKALREKPDLPMKAYVDGGRIVEGGQWYIGEVTEVKVAEITIYDGVIYGKDEIERLEGYISDELYEHLEYIKLPDEEFEKAVEERVKELSWERVILIKVHI